MAGKKRRAVDLAILNRPQLLAKIRGMSSIRNKALASFLYLSGCRISEVLGTKKIIKHYQNIGGIREVVKSEEFDLPPLKKENVEILQDKDLILLHQVNCLKHKRDIPKRTIPIVISKDIDFVKLFMDHWVNLPSGSPLFRMTRQNAWKIINKEMGMFPHLLIHKRCSHLVVNQAFGDHDLRQFRGWSDSRPSSVYTHLRWQDIASKMK